MSIPEIPEIPESQTDAESARAIYAKLRDADLIASKNRVKIQAMFDGEPPQS